MVVVALQALTSLRVRAQRAPQARVTGDDPFCSPSHGSHSDYGPSAFAVSRSTPKPVRSTFVTRRRPSHTVAHFSVQFKAEMDLLSIGRIVADGQ